MTNKRSSWLLCVRLSVAFYALVFYFPLWWHHETPNIFTVYFYDAFFVSMMLFIVSNLCFQILHSQHPLLWLIVVLVYNGVFDEKIWCIPLFTIANWHRWLLVIQSKTSHKMRAEQDWPLLVSTSSTNRQSHECVCSHFSIVTDSFKKWTLCGVMLDVDHGCISISSLADLMMGHDHAYLMVSFCYET